MEQNKTVAESVKQDKNKIEEENEGGLTIKFPLLTPINAGNEINFDTPDVKFRAASVSIADVEDEDKATRLAKKILRDYQEREASDGSPPLLLRGASRA